MNGTSHHLTLEELTGDTELSASARTHLTTCASCAAQTRDWTAVASGARLITAGTCPSPDLFQGVLEAIGERRRPKPRYRVLLPYAAAAAVVLSAGGYGLAASLGPGRGPTAATTAAGLTATGCTALDLAAGQLTKVSGQDLVLTPSDGHPVTVTTSGGTTFLRVETGSLSDIADGAHVLVAAWTSGGKLTADSITIMPATAAGPRQVPPGGPGQNELLTGTVAAASAAGFTVVASDGSRYGLTTTPATTVVRTERISASQLRPGETTTAAGAAGADGTLAASTVEQLGIPAAAWQKLRPAAPPPPADVPSGTLAPAKVQPVMMTLSGLGCAPSAVTTAYLLSAAS